MSASACTIPAATVLALAAIGIIPKGRIGKTALDLGSVCLGLGIGLPLSIAVFPPVTVKRG